jgi:ethanolamine utilization protein EutN
MILGKVLESVVSTQKNKSLDSKKIFVIQPLNEKCENRGSVFLALDSVQAGPGDTVIICREGNGCRQILSDDGAPVNAVIAGIVDAVNLD